MTLDRDIVFEQNGMRIVFHSENGAIKELVWRGKNMVIPADELFSIGFRDGAGELSVVRGSDFSEKSFQDNQFSFAGHRDYPALTVDCHVEYKEDFWRFRIRLRGLLKTQNELEWIDYPHIFINGKLSGRGGQGELFWPTYEGTLIDDPYIREEKHSGFFRYKLMTFPNTGSNGYYPGNAQMQYLAYFDGQGDGLYFAAHDYEHTTKAVEFEPLPGEKVRLSLQTFCGRSEKKDDFELNFDMVLSCFAGDWLDAAEIYRAQFVSHDPQMGKKLIDNKNIPQWYKDSPVVMMYAVRGDGDDKGAMSGNEYFPYLNAAGALEQLSEQCDSRIMALLMHWEGTAPWAPPYVWPPYGGEAELAKLRDRLHQKGNLLGLYCSGTAWTQTSSIIEYSREEQCEQENLRAQMSQSPKGEIKAFICNGPKGHGQRQGFDCCIGQDWTQKTVREEIAKLAQFGADYTQYFDQNLGGSAHLCYAKNHQHPDMPGVWQTRAMEKLLAESSQESAPMLLGCEASAAQPYVQYLPFSDSRYSNAFWFAARPVWAYNYVFHEYLNNFMGNQNGYDNAVDIKTAPDNLLHRCAHAFIAGDMLSGVLKDAGQIHWCWVMKWKEAGPDQASVLTLIRNLNFWRKQQPNFLLYGKMVKPLTHIKCGKFVLHSKVSGRDMEFDNVYHSSWRSPQDGKLAQFLVNYRRTEEVIVLSAPVMITTMNGEKITVRANQEYRMAPLSAVMATL